MPAGDVILRMQDGSITWYSSKDLGWVKRAMFGAENVLIDEVLRLRAALNEIRDHSVCCDARHLADRVLSGGEPLLQPESRSK